jgi:predicted SnoaL-like aldol condensation-catalyzing enzyme
MIKKEIAEAFLKSVGYGKVKEAFSRFVAPGFIHHNQYFKGDRLSLEKAMEEAHNESPNKSVEIRHCYQDGDIVITHSLVVKADADIAVVHIFKFKEDKIIELWDLGQVISPDSPNENGLF